MITSVISAKGIVRAGQFSRVEEYIFIIEFGASSLVSTIYNMLDNEIKRNLKEVLNGWDLGEEHHKLKEHPGQISSILFSFAIVMGLFTLSEM